MSGSDRLTWFELAFKEQQFQTELEEKMSQLLTAANVKWLENEIVKTSNDKLLLSPEGCGSLEEFARKHEYIRGQLDILMYLIAMSEARHSELNIDPNKKDT